MIWTNVALADETIDGITYSLNSSSSTATVTNTPSGNVVIPATVTYNNRKYNVTAITGVNSGITSIEIPEGVTSIGGFSQKNALTQIVIPSTIQRIEQYTFNKCSSLISVTLPEGLTYIGNYAFMDCSKLSDITIPSTITSMGDCAFRNCINLKNITWNAKRCIDFTSEWVAPFEIAESFAGSIKDFRNYYTTSITFGDEVEYIPAYLCYGFHALSSIQIPNSVKEIGEKAFYGYIKYEDGSKSNRYDSNLKSLTLGTSLVKIGALAFYGRNGLASLTIPDKCTTIGAQAFQYCSRLSTITFGKSINIIGDYAFAIGNNEQADELRTINIYANTPPALASSYAFLGHHNDITLNVRSKALDAYKAAAVWKDMYVQVMENDLRTFMLDVSSSDEGKGTTTSGGMYDEDSEVLIYAAVKDGYKFSRWNDGNTDNPRTVKMIGNLSFVAQFEPFIPVPTYTITTSTTAVEGSVVGGGVYESGAQVTLAAVENTGYHFVQWADGNTANPRYVTVTADASYVAQFAKDPVKYTLTTSSTNASQGTAYGQGKYEEGTNVAIFAVANDGYYFTQWHDGNTDNPRMITVSNDAMYYANFAQNPVAPTLYEVKIKPENTSQGWTTEGGSFGMGTRIMIYAYPANGFEFSQWSDGNTDNPRFLTISGAVDLSAKFKVQSINSINPINATTTGSSVRKVIRKGIVNIEYGDKTYTTQGIEIK